MSETLAELKQWLRLVPVGDFSGATYKDRMRNAVRFIAAAEHAEQALAERDAEIVRLRRAIAEANLSLSAIGEPEPYEPPDAKVCAAIARSCLIRIANALGGTDADL